MALLWSAEDQPVVTFLLLPSLQDLMIVLCFILFSVLEGFCLNLQLLSLRFSETLEGSGIQCVCVCPI